MINCPDKTTKIEKKNIKTYLTLNGSYGLSSVGSNFSVV